MALNRLLLLSALCLSTAACGDEIGPHQATIQAIESTVTLPRGASPLASYERYYALDKSGTILGVYTNHDEDFRRFVVQMSEDDRVNGRPVHNPRLVKAGESVWLDDAEDLPYSAGGGCSYISVEYDPARQRIARVDCNGSY